MSHQALPTQHLNGKEITGRNGFPVCFEKHRPRNAPAASRGWLDQVIFENAADRAAPDLNIQVAQSAVDRV